VAIVTEEYYLNTFMGLTVAPGEFPQLEAWAERAICEATRGRVTEENFAALPLCIKTAYQNAV